jgi:hypothetical protein
VSLWQAGKLRTKFSSQRSNNTNDSGLTDQKSKVVPVPHMYREMPETVTIPSRNTDQKSVRNAEDLVKPSASAGQPTHQTQPDQPQTREQDETSHRQQPKDPRPAFQLDSKSSKMLGKKGQYDIQRTNAVSRSYDTETFAQKHEEATQNRQPEDYYYRKAGSPDYLNLEVDKKLFKIDKQSKPGPPEIHYQMSCRIV